MGSNFQVCGAASKYRQFVYLVGISVSLIVKLKFQCSTICKFLETYFAPLLVKKLKIHTYEVKMHGISLHIDFSQSQLCIYHKIRFFYPLMLIETQGLCIPCPCLEHFSGLERIHTSQKNTNSAHHWQSSACILCEGNPKCLNHVGQSQLNQAKQSYDWSAGFKILGLPSCIDMHNSSLQKIEDFTLPNREKST